MLTAEQAEEVRARFGTPCYVYDRTRLEAAARTALAIPAPFGLTVRYAMKANPSRGILNVFRGAGLHIDASSDYEVERALNSGFKPDQIQLTAQVPSRRLAEHVAAGVLFNACSLHQLEMFTRVCPGGEVSIRVNPGLGSGSSNRTNTGGPSSSFGIWHAFIGAAKELANSSGVRLTRLHSHIGSGTDPEIWKLAARLTLDVAARLPDVQTINLGGGFKVGRMPAEPTVDLGAVGDLLREQLLAFAEEHGRQLHLEIEPGTYLVANAGCVLASCVDVVSTGPDGYCFAKLDAGMPELLRPSLYGAQHPITVLAKDRAMLDVVFVGPSCESGDVLTPAPADPECLATREVPEPRIGDLVVIGGAGAYCASMSAINYNSYPQASEVMIEQGTFNLLRRRQKAFEIWANEVDAEMAPSPLNGPLQLNIAGA